MKNIVILFIFLTLISCSPDDNNSLLIGSWILSEKSIDNVLVVYSEDDCELHNTLIFTKSKVTDKIYFYDSKYEFCDIDSSLTGSYTYEDSTIRATNIVQFLFVKSLNRDTLIFEKQINNSIHLFTYIKN